MFKKRLKKMMRSGKMMWILFMCLAVGAAAGTLYQNSRKQEIQTANSGFVSDRISTETGTTEINGLKTDENSQDYSRKTVDDKQKTESKAVSSGQVKAEYSGDLTSYRLHWPVEGEVLREFNMDETVYFPTLNQYQCSSAVLIQAEQGTPVTAPADAEVYAIGSSEELGNYMVLNIGSNGQITLGQLKEIQVKKGDSVEAGEMIARVSEPASCRTVEGDSLYIQLKENGKAVDPLDYMEL